MNFRAPEGRQQSVRELPMKKVKGTAKERAVGVEKRVARHEPGGRHPVAQGVNPGRRLPLGVPDLR